jgi:hypothetical protein
MVHISHKVKDALEKDIQPTPFGAPRHALTYLVLTCDFGVTEAIDTRCVVCYSRSDLRTSLFFRLKLHRR